MSGSEKDTDELTSISSEDQYFPKKYESPKATLPKSRSKSMLIKTSPDIKVDTASFSSIVLSMDLDDHFDQYDRLDNFITKLKHKNALTLMPLNELDTFVKKIHKIISKNSNIEFTKNYKTEAKALIKLLEPSKTYLNLVSGKDIDQSLVIDELLGEILKIIQKALEKMIIPLAYQPSKECVETLENKRIKKCMASLCSVIEYFSVMISKNYFQENQVISLAELLIKTLFAEGAEILHLTCNYTLASIANAYNQITIHIINDIICNLHILTNDPNLAFGAKNKKLYCRDYTVTEGVEVKFSTFMVVNVLQNCSSLTKAIRTNGKIDLKSVAKQIQETLSISQHFVNKICDRAFKPKSKNQEFRVFLDFFIKDLLKLMFRPEFPLAFQMLNLIIMKIFSAFKAFSAVIRHYAIDEISVIASCIKQSIHEIKMSPIVPQNVTKVPKINHPSDNFMASMCICKEGWSNVKNDMIECEECWRWFHLECVGVNKEKALDNAWFCDDCRLFQFLRHISVKEVEINEDVAYALPHEIISINLKYQSVYQELIINYLMSNRGRSEESSRSLWLAHWLGEKKDKNLKYLWQASNKSINLPRLSEKGTIKLLRQYLLSFDLGLAYLHMQHRIINLFTAVQPLTRAKALKSLSSIVSADPECLSEDIIETAVTERLHDTSIAVREATVELIGKFLTFKSEFSDTYFAALLERLKDKGPSVRKRVIKILGEIISNDPEDQRRIEIYCEVIKRIGDDSESIRDAVVSLFEKEWFLSGAKKFLNLFVEVLKVLKIKEPFTMLFKAVLERNKKLNDKIDKIAQKATEKLISSTVLSDSIIYAKLIEIISTTAPELIVDQVSTLHQFLTASQSAPEESELLTSICIVIGQSAEHLTSLNTSRIKKIEVQLLTLIFTQGSNVVTQAINTLCKIVQLCSHDYNIISSLISKCFDLLKDYPKSSFSDKKNLPAIFRALLTLGLCIKFTENSVIKDLVLEQNKSFKNSIFKIYKKFILTKNDSIKEKALDALSLTWVRFPKLLSKSDSLIKEAWDSAETPIKKIKLLQMFYEFMWHYSETIKENSDEDKGNVISVIYGYLDSILDCTIDENLNVRENAAEALKLIYILGSVNASRLVSKLFCMLGDESLAVKEAGFYCIENGYVKNPEMITINLQNSLKEAFEFQAKILKQRDLKESYYPKVYALVKERKTIRNKFLNTILNALEPSDPDYTEFLCEMISILSYSNTEELGFILQHINGKIQISAFRLLRIIKIRKSNKNSLNRDLIIECLLQIQLFVLKNYLVSAYQIKSYNDFEDRPIQKIEDANLFQEEYEEFKDYHKFEEIKAEELNKFKYKV